MKKEFDHKDVLRFLYNEMGSMEREAFMDALAQDEALWQTFEETQNSMEGLSSTELNPSDFSCQKILTQVTKIPPQLRKKPARQYAFGKNHFVNLHHLASVFMVFFTTITIGIVMYLYKTVETKQVFSQDQPRLQWEANYLENKLDLVKINLNNLSGDRFAPIKIYNNTYRLVKIDPNSSFSKSVVLLNFR